MSLTDENGYPVFTDEDRCNAGYLPCKHLEDVGEDEKLIRQMAEVFQKMRANKELNPIPKNFVHGSMFNKSWVKIFDYHGQDLLKGTSLPYKNAKEAIQNLDYVKQTGLNITNDLITVNETNENELKMYLNDEIGLEVVKKFSVQSGIIGGGTDDSGKMWLLIMGRCNSVGQPGFLYGVYHQGPVPKYNLPSETAIVEYRDPVDTSDEADENTTENIANTENTEETPSTENADVATNTKVTLSDIRDDVLAVAQWCVITCADTGRYVLDIPLVDETINLVKEASSCGYSFLRRKISCWRNGLKQSNNSDSNDSPSNDGRSTQPVAADLNPQTP